MKFRPDMARDDRDGTWVMAETAEARIKALESALSAAESKAEEKWRAEIRDLHGQLAEAEAALAAEREHVRHLVDLCVAVMTVLPDNDAALKELEVARLRAEIAEMKGRG